MSAAVCLLEESMPVEYRFYCPELQREVGTAECYDRGNTGRACYGECCEHVERAVCSLILDMLQASYGDLIAVEKNDADDTLTICFHERFRLKAYYDSLYRRAVFDTSANGVQGYEVTVGDTAGLVQIIGKLLSCELLFVVRPGRFRSKGRLQLIECAELKRKWRSLTRGLLTSVVDSKGVYEKKVFADILNPDAC